MRVDPSPVHGLGVFAAKDVPKHTCITAYPIDLLVLRATGHNLRQLGDPAVVFSRWMQTNG